MSLAIPDDEVLCNLYRIKDDCLDSITEAEAREDLREVLSLRTSAWSAQLNDSTLRGRLKRLAERCRPFAGKVCTKKRPGGQRILEPGRPAPRLVGGTCVESQYPT